MGEDDKKKTGHVWKWIGDGMRRESEERAGRSNGERSGIRRGSICWGGT